MKTDLNLMVAGPQGSGINFTSDTFAKVMNRQGYHVYTNAELFSTIKGEHSYFRVRVSDAEIRSYSKRVDILIPLDSKSVILHKDEVSENGVILSEEKIDDKRYQALDYKGILQKVATKFNRNLSELNVMKNTIALAAAVKMANLPSEELKKVITENFSSRKNLADLNNAIVDEVYLSFDSPKIFKLPKVQKVKRMLSRVTLNLLLVQGTVNSQG